MSDALDDNDDKLSLERVSGLLLVKDTPKGRAVFAKEAISSRTVLERCPVLVLSPDENTEHICKTNLYNYTYNWPFKSTNVVTQALPLGLGSLFNHSNHPRRCNVGWTKSADTETQLIDGRIEQGNDYITYVTLRQIEAGEELCISYGPKERLTFEDVEGDAPTADVDEQAEGAGVLGNVTLGLDED